MKGKPNYIGYLFCLCPLYNCLVLSFSPYLLMLVLPVAFRLFS